MSEPVAGRRRHRPAEEKGGTDVEIDADFGSGSSGAAPKPSWGGPSGESKGAEPRPREEKKTQSARVEDDEDGEEVVIPMIPELEEATEGVVEQQVAAAPQNARQVPTLRELDAELRHTLPSSSHGGIDLSILTSALLPKEAVEEPDVEWDFDRLLQSVSAEMQAEEDRIKANRDKGAKGEEAKTGGADELAESA